MAAGSVLGDVGVVVALVLASTWCLHAVPPRFGLHHVVPPRGSNNNGLNKVMIHINGSVVSSF